MDRDLNIVPLHLRQVELDEIDNGNIIQTLGKGGPVQRDC